MMKVAHAEMMREALDELGCSCAIREAMEVPMAARASITRRVPMAKVAILSTLFGVSR
jgi:hypothetical protein